MFVGFNLLPQMAMVVGTVSTRVFVRVGSPFCVLVQVSVRMLMVMSMPMLVFMRMDFAVVGMLVSVTVNMFVSMFMCVLVRSFHFSLHISAKSCCSCLLHTLL
jgi:hypothetical protein